jgi:hypothetical protein
MRLLHRLGVTHCKHKTLTGLIKYKVIDKTNGDERTEIIDNLLKSTIARAN